MSTVIDRFLPVHTRYVTKEEEREKQETVKDVQKRKVARDLDIEVDRTSTTRCAGASCNETNLYNQGFDDDLLFGKK
jgi:hypothetical protein